MLQLGINTDVFDDNLKSRIIKEWKQDFHTQIRVCGPAREHFRNWISSTLQGKYEVLSEDYIALTEELK